MEKQENKLDEKEEDLTHGYMSGLSKEEVDEDGEEWDVQPVHRRKVGQHTVRHTWKTVTFFKEKF